MTNFSHHGFDISWKKEVPAPERQALIQQKHYRPFERFRRTEKKIDKKERKHAILHTGIFLSLCVSVIITQIYNATISRSVSDMFRSNHDERTGSGINEKQVISPAITMGEDISLRKLNSDQNSFGACLMVKDDNDLLYEWVAYHYINLPLRYLVIGNDLNSLEDPNDVLSRWKRANIKDLEYWVLEASGFINRHGNYTERFEASLKNEYNMTEEERKSFHHHALIHRQKGFITACSELLQNRSVGWTIFIDSDELVTFNELTVDDAKYQVGGTGHFSMKNTSYEIRKNLLTTAQNKTILDVVLDLEKSGNITECYTMPRLLVGALENSTCEDDNTRSTIQEQARSLLGDRYEHLSTLRFFQHAKKGDFASSKFGKVMMDLSRISTQTVQTQKPRNIHRPYSMHCGNAAAAHFPDSFFFLLHYIGTWERYASRSDNRRLRSEWEQRAFFDEGSPCAFQRVPYWLPRFRHLVGEARSQFLLGSKSLNDFKT